MLSSTKCARKIRKEIETNLKIKGSRNPKVEVSERSIWKKEEWNKILRIKSQDLRGNLQRSHSSCWSGTWSRHSGFYGERHSKKLGPRADNFRAEEVSFRWSWSRGGSSSDQHRWNFHICWLVPILLVLWMLPFFWGVEREKASGGGIAQSSADWRSGPPVKELERWNCCRARSHSQKWSVPATVAHLDLMECLLPLWPLRFGILTYRLDQNLRCFQKLIEAQLQPKVLQMVWSRSLNLFGGQMEKACFWLSYFCRSILEML